MKNLAILVVVLAACASEGADDDVQVAGTVRPPTVPVAYIPTPNGWFHPSCVIEVRDDERVTAEGNIASIAANTPVRAVPACAYPAFDPHGAALDTPSGGTGGTSWVEDAVSTTTGPVSYLHAQWQVPPAPTHVNGQVIFLFPGLMDSLTSTSILQPVLSWAAGYGWQLTSWNCCPGGNEYHSASIAVTGTTVSGDIQGTGPGGACNFVSGLCTSWKITSRNGTAGTSTVLNTTEAVPEVVVFGGVLEAYSIDRCDAFPAASSDTFSAFSIKNQAAFPLAIPAWTNQQQGYNPTCSYSVTHTATTATMSWSSAPTACTPLASRNCCPYAGGCGCVGRQYCSEAGAWGACEGAAPVGDECP